MSNRPVDWTPISEGGDPTPGDPQAVREEARRFEDIASTIRDQAKLLREAGDSQNLKGQYAEKLKEGANDLAGKLSRVEGRYDKVGGLLREWSRELEYAQEETRKALSQAKVDEKDEDRVEDAKSRMSEAVTHFHRHGNRIAGQINEAVNDDVEDTIWNDMVGWAKDHSDGFKLFLDILGWIGTALAIATLFVPGLNILAVTVLIAVLGAAVLAGRLLLVAAGKATWVEVCFDAFGLLTMGIGKASVAALKGANATARGAASVSRTAQLKQGLADTKFLRNQLSNALANASDDATKAAIRGEMHTLRKMTLNSVENVSHNPEVSPLAKAANLFDDEAFSLYKSTMENASRFGDDVVPAEAVDKASTAFKYSVAASWGGSVVDYGDKFLGDNDTINALSDAGVIPFEKGSLDVLNDLKGNHWQSPAVSAW